MAFKRSAVRSRLSPPKDPETFGFRIFFFLPGRQYIAYLLTFSNHIDAPHRTALSTSGRVQTTLSHCGERDKSPAPRLPISGAVDFRRINKMYEENGNHSLQSAGFYDKIAIAYWQYCTQMFRIVQ